MVRLIFSLCMFFSLSFSSAFEVAKSLVRPEKYNENENLMKILFKNKTYHKNGKIDSLEIIKTLNSHKLLDLNFDNVENLELSFQINGNVLLGLQVLNSALEELGYSYFLTKNAKKQNDKILWNIIMQTQSMINPISLHQKLLTYGSKLSDITREGLYSWSFSIDTSNAYLKSIELTEEINNLEKPNAPFWINVKHKNELIISTNNADAWLPKLTFFDSKLNAISEIILNQTKHDLNISVPEGSHYLLLDDKYSLENIKHGLSISTN